MQRFNKRSVFEMWIISDKLVSSPCFSSLFMQVMPEDSVVQPHLVTIKTMPWELLTNVSYSIKIQLSRRMGFRWATPCDTIKDARYKTRNDRLTHAAWVPGTTTNTTIRMEKLTTTFLSISVHVLHSLTTTLLTANVTWLSCTRMSKIASSFVAIVKCTHSLRRSY